MSDIGLEIRGIKLDLIDLVTPYGVKGKDLLPFEAENIAILELPSQERQSALCELAKKIIEYYKKD